MQDVGICSRKVAQIRQNNDKRDPERFLYS